MIVKTNKHQSGRRKPKKQTKNLTKNYDQAALQEDLDQLADWVWEAKWLMMSFHHDKVSCSTTTG